MVDIEPAVEIWQVAPLLGTLLEHVVFECYNMTQGYKGGVLEPLSYG